MLTTYHLHICNKPILLIEREVVNPRSFQLTLLWECAWEVLIWTTKHIDDTLEIQRMNPVRKPTCIIEYIEVKAFIGPSDHTKSYCKSLRRGVKCYRKLPVELLFRTHDAGGMSWWYAGGMSTNVLYSYHQLTNGNRQINPFK